VDKAELMDSLLALADGAELEVRVVGGASRGDTDAGLTSAVCKVRGSVWVVISLQDPVDVQIEVLARALETHAGDYLESHYLPPAVRARLGGSHADSE